MEHLEFLVEEASMETALAVLGPRILDPTPIFRIHPHQGKPDLLQKLPGRLRGYRPWLPADYLLAYWMARYYGFVSAQQ